MDYAFTTQWIARVEYIYDQFGTRTYGFNALTTGQFSDRLVSLNQNTVRAVIDYKF